MRAGREAAQGDLTREWNDSIGKQLKVGEIRVVIGWNECLALIICKHSVWLVPSDLYSQYICIKNQCTKDELHKKELTLLCTTFGTTSFLYLSYHST